jgi:hypothetical protein
VTSAREILQRLTAFGARVECYGDRLKLRTGRRPVPAALIKEARAAKPELLALLTTPKMHTENAHHPPTRGRGEHLRQQPPSKPAETTAFTEDAQMSTFDERVQQETPRMPTEDAHLGAFDESSDFRRRNNGLPEREGRPDSEDAHLSIVFGSGEHVRSDLATADPSRWCALYEERAARREFDGGYPRAKAELLAWREIEWRWHMAHGERVPPDLCAGCRRPIGMAKSLDLIDGARLHDSGYDCLIRHGERWRRAATRALAAIGLQPPAGAP